jgi:hypothetical protein
MMYELREVRDGVLQTPMQSGVSPATRSAFGGVVNKNIPRSIGAVLAGALTGAILTIATDTAMRATGIFPAEGGLMSNPLFALATAYRTVYGIAGAYIAARLAPYRPMMHAMVLAATGLFVTILGTVVTWNKGPEFGPHWYPISLVILAVPTAWLGAKIREMQLPTSPE